MTATTPTTKMNIPKTPTGVGILLTNLLIVLLSIFLVNIKLPLLISIGIVLIALASILKKYFLFEVLAYHAIVMTNAFTGARRVLFPGLNIILPWESAEEKEDNDELNYIDLKKSIPCICKGKIFQTKDSTMVVDYLIAMHLNISGSYHDASTNVLNFDSIKEEALKELAEKKITGIFSGYYSTHELNNLIDESAVMQEMFEKTSSIPDIAKRNNAIVSEIESNYGVKVTIVLENSNPDKLVQEYYDTVAKADAFDKAVDVLVKGGMDRSKAELKVEKMMTDMNTTEQIFTIKGLEKLTSLVMPNVGGTSTKKTK
ncbi:MAG: hypothetical protein V4504_00925 [Patescibacteria group bacterium]